MKPARPEADKERVDDKIKTIIADELGIAVKELTNSADLRQDLNSEDVEIADLLVKLEKEFAVGLTADDAKTLKTVGDIMNFFKEG